MLDKDEVINFLHTGYNDQNYFSYLHVVTSGGKELKWGSLDGSVKGEQKHIKKYESAFIRGKLVCEEE